MFQSVVNILGVGIVYFILSSTASAQNSSIELMCRAKAKEVAAETYKGCVTDLKQAQIEKIRNDYQGKLKELKDYYDNELKRVNGKAPAQSANPAPKPKNVVSNGVRKNTTTGARSPVKTLPSKTSGVIETSPMVQQDNSSETAVIQNAEPSMSIEVRPQTGARHNSDFEDDTVENPVAE